MRARTSNVWQWLLQGLPALAVYALLLQSFLTGAAPAASFDPTSAPLCSEMADGSGNHAPGQMPGHAECLCIAACASHAPAALLPGGSTRGTIREASIIAFISPELATPLVASAIRSPGARAPPRD
jgi:hypothetical protein